MEEKKIDERNELVEPIIDLEQDMFVAVRALDESSVCQENLKTFRLMRWMTHSAHGEEFLESYLQDLVEATQAGRNLMTEKYAIMEGYFPSTITETMKFIVFSEKRWMEDLKKRYPNIFRDQGNFQRYIEADLQILSQRSLQFYYKEVMDGLNTECNLVEERYENLYRRLGYCSLEEVNARPAPV